MTTAGNVLRCARSLVETPERWTQNALARNAFGQRVNVDHGDAVAFCVQGAVLRAANVHSTTAGEIFYIERALQSLEPRFPETPRSIGAWNDVGYRKHADVLAVLDRAIEIAEQFS